MPPKCTHATMSRIGPVQYVQVLIQDFTIKVVSLQLGISKNMVFGVYLGAKVLT